MTNCIAYFNGSGSWEVSEDERKWLEKFGKCYFNQRVKIMAYHPPYRNGKHRWVEYKKHAEDSETCETKDDMPKAIDEVSQHIYSDFRTLNRQDKVIFIGSGMGCIPAYYFANYYSKHEIFTVEALVMHNGCPAISDADFKKYSEKDADRWMFPFAVLFLLSNSDHHWQHHRMLYLLAWYLKANILSFPGNHEQLPSARHACSALTAADGVY